MGKDDHWQISHAPFSPIPISERRLTGKSDGGGNYSTGGRKRGEKTGKDGWKERCAFSNRTRENGKERLKQIKINIKIAML